MSARLLAALRHTGVSLVKRPVLLRLLLIVAFGVRTPAVPDAAAAVLPLDELKPGQVGEVWTVFQGQTPEPFTVEVAGVIRNALGPGKSLILCRLTDPRVQNMGAVAGMSGSPLYIDGKFAGALSYQVQRFETVRYAGFTPASDLIEVSLLDQGAPSSFEPADNVATARGLEAGGALRAVSADSPAFKSGERPSFAPLVPVFAFGGITPRVAALFRDDFQALGIALATLGGHASATDFPPAGDSVPDPQSVLLRPGSAVAVALSTGDITLAGTGSVSHVDGNRILAFGHPMLSLGAVELPMALAEIITILPSNLNSVKISNTGPVIGTIRQDRLSAIYGEIGPIPPMLPVVVRTPVRTLRFSTIRHDRLTPMITAAGLAQAILGSNENGLAEGFRIKATLSYPEGRRIEADTLYAGPQGFAVGIGGLVQRLAASLNNPVADVFPVALSFMVEPLASNPSANVDSVQLSRTRLAAGETLQVALTLRDFQGAAVRETIPVEIPPGWAGRRLELVILSGFELDRQAGRPVTARLSQIRTFDAYLDLMSDQRAGDGLYLAVVERASAFIDQTQSTLDYPGSLERIARRADDARYQKRSVIVPLWEKHILSGRLLQFTYRQPLQIAE